MDGVTGGARVLGDPEGLLRSALEKIVFFECRVSQLESELGAARGTAERARGDAARAEQRAVELERAIASERSARADAERRAGELEDRVRLLSAERERLLDGLVDRARVSGAPVASGADAPEEGGADLAGFIAELRAEIETLRGSAFATGAPVAKAPRPAPAAHESVTAIADRFDADGRVGLTARDTDQMKALLATRADRALYERSMEDLGAKDAPRRLRAVRALEALGSRAAAPLLAAALGREDDGEVKAVLLAALARFEEPFARELAERELGDARPGVRVAALEALAAVAPGAAGARLAEALSDESPVVRRRAALLLGFQAGDRADEALAVALCDEDRGVARAAAAALSGRPSARAQEALTRGIEHPDASVRRAAGAAISRISGEVVDADATPSVRRATSRRIAERLAAMDGDAIRAAVLRGADEGPAATPRATTARAAAASAPSVATPAPPAATTPPRVPSSSKHAHVAQSAPSAPAAVALRQAQGERQLATVAVREAQGERQVSAVPVREARGERQVSAVALRPARGERQLATVAVREAPGERQDGRGGGDDAPDLAPRIVAEIRAALRGCTPEGLAAHLGAAPALVEGALLALAAKGTVARRGTRWFMS